MSGGHDIEARLELARQVASEAGEILLERFGKIGAVTHKGAVDLVTEADLAAEAHILARLGEAFPQDAILAEEGGEGGLADAELCWMVDPLDGTNNYVHRLDQFAVSLGLARRGRPVAGVIHAPAKRTTYHGGEGLGAWCNGQPMRVSETRQLGETLLATGFPYDRRTRAHELLVQLKRGVERSRGVRRMGSAALDLAAVACGSFGGYWEVRLKPWDMAAGVALVREAGGRVTTCGGAPFDVFGPTILASNGHLHQELVSMVADAVG